MLIPKPWCTENPRTCIQVVGFSEILISLVGGILLATLPVIMLDLNYEVRFIKDYYIIGDSYHSTSVSADRLYTMNVSGIYNNDCNELSFTINEFLQQYMKAKFEYIITINGTMLVEEKNEKNETISKRIFCEIHVQTRRDPKKKIVEIQNKGAFSFHSVVALAVCEYTGETASQTEKKIKVIPPTSNKISQGNLFPRPIGTDPERTSCITKMRNIDLYEVLDSEKMMYSMLGASAATSLVAGCLLVTSVFIVSRTLLTITFLAEMISIGLLACGIFVANDSEMCLFQYGGISVHSLDSPDVMQTIITYSCSIYAASFKFYCLWTIAAYTDISASQASDDPKHSDYVADMAKEIIKINQEISGLGNERDNDGHNGAKEDNLKDDGKTKRHSVARTHPPPPSEAKKNAADNGPSTNISPTNEDEGIQNKRKSQSRKSTSRKSKSRKSMAVSQERAGSGQGNTLVPQKGEKNLFGTTFVGGSRLY